MDDIHFISRASAREAATDRRRTYVAACGKINPPHYTPNGKQVTCAECRRNMLPEETRA